MPNFLFILSRPTLDRSYRRGLKKMFSSNALVLSSVGGSPGRMRR